MLTIFGADRPAFSASTLVAASCRRLLQPVRGAWGNCVGAAKMAEEVALRSGYLRVPPPFMVFSGGGDAERDGLLQIVRNTCYSWLGKQIAEGTDGRI